MLLLAVVDSRGQTLTFDNDDGAGQALWNRLRNWDDNQLLPSPSTLARIPTGVPPLLNPRTLYITDGGTLSATASVGTLLINASASDSGYYLLKATNASDSGSGTARTATINFSSTPAGITYLPDPILDPDPISQQFDVGSNSVTS
jgi:hypothetical protein